MYYIFAQTDKHVLIYHLDKHLLRTDFLNHYGTYRTRNYIFHFANEQATGSKIFPLFWSLRISSYTFIYLIFTLEFLR